MCGNERTPVGNPFSGTLSCFLLYTFHITLFVSLAETVHARADRPIPDFSPGGCIHLTWRERDGGELKPALVTLRAEAHPGVLVLKYDTLRAKLLKCSEGRSGANLLKWATPPAKLAKPRSTVRARPVMVNPFPASVHYSVLRIGACS